MRILFISIMAIIILGANYYVFYRIWNMMPANTIARIILIVLAILIIASPFVSILSGGSMPSALTSILYKVGTSWLFIFSYLLIAFLLFDLIRVTHLLPMEKIMYNNPLALGVLAGFFIIVFTSGYFHYLNKKRVELPISINKELSEPLKIVAISDLHLGYGIKNDELEKWITLINAENPDIVLIAGDLIDNNVKPLYEYKIEEDLKKIKSKYGVFLAPGNHEYISGIEKSTQFLKDAGINVLKDSAIFIDNSFYVIGRDDRTNPKRESLPEIIKSLDKSKPMILLDHQPYQLEEAENNNIDIQISGHTHYGQIWPISWITDMIYEKSHGYLQKGNSHIYVSSGLGLWGGKFRIGTQSEYVVIELSRK